MKEMTLTYSIITPLFGYGAYRDKSAIRPSEIKGMMRYVYRLACPSPVSDLFITERELFGGAAVSGENGSDHSSALSSVSAVGGHASPVRLVVREKGRAGKEKLLLHGKTKQNYPIPCFAEEEFQLLLRMNPAPGTKPVIKCSQDIDLAWYADLITLAFILCGVGRRSRKGRGKAALKDLKFSEKEEAMRWICGVLNQTAGISARQGKTELYLYEKGKIIPTFNRLNVKRPVIQKIQIGGCLAQEQIKTYLAIVDQLCHEELEERGSRVIRATGRANPRFASPLWIGMVQTARGVCPVYLFITAVDNGRSVDRDCSERDEFYNEVERRMNREVKQ